MPPDLNSFEHSPTIPSSPLQHRSSLNTSDATMSNQSPSPRSSSVSLAAAATINAADRSRRSSLSNNNRISPRSSRVSERRRSAVAMNLNLNDPSMPGPGELSSNDRRSSIGNAFRTASPTSLGGSPTVATGDPHHQRTPSLGEIHQELEQEQEAQVNRLLHMIRVQELQLQQLRQQQQQQESTSGNTAIDDSTPTSERSISFPNTAPPLPAQGSRSSLQQPSSLSNRRGSRPSSQTTSPALPPLSSSHHGSLVEPTTSNSSGEWLHNSGTRRSSRDEGAFYQAETAMLTRENQMLKLRIRELERQVNDLNSSPAHTPATASNLTSTPSSSGVDTGSTSEASASASQSQSQEAQKT
ncbi:hypothetical protein FQN54_004164 [Arachnomyces sp. PD_36]|nr:hypothetical protein FQN54_004164 [Arachnomyces sp. PD_36]